MWYLRLSCLARMRLFNQASAECSNLFALLDAVEPQEIQRQIYERILPFELEVFRTRLPLWTNDPLGYLDELHALLSKCKQNVREAKDPALIDTWEERCARVTLIIASQLIDMKVWAIARVSNPTNDNEGVCDCVRDSFISCCRWVTRIEVNNCPSLLTNGSPAISGSTFQPS
jgi:trafficking protein particle complex subunit 12